MPLKQVVVETHLRSVSSASLYINADDSWSVGLNVNNLVKVNYGNLTSIDDTTFDFSAVDVEKLPGGGYRLFVESDNDPNTIVQADLDATGKVINAVALSQEQMFAAETQFGVDLNGNGGFGSAPTAIQGGSVNLYMSGTGVYQLGTAPENALNITVAGASLTAKIMPRGWELVNAEPSATGYNVYLRDSAGATFQANLNPQAAYVSGAYMTPEQITTRETSTGADINGDQSVPASTGWTSVLKDSYIKTTVDSAIAGDGKMSYGEVVALANGIIQAHTASGNSAISATELADLQAISSRGKNVFDAATSDYLSFVFSKMVDGSVANTFYTGGQASRAPLGNLVPNSPLATFQKLVDKWLLGGDNPAPSAGGDAATGKAATTVGTYAQSSGTLFVDGVKPADIKQGQVGDCFLAAALLSIADSEPGAITSMVVDNGVVNGSHTWGVRFFDSTGKANWVTVNDLLPVTAAGSTSLIYGGNPSGNLNGEIWFPLIEKAYAQANTLNILPRNEQSGQNSYWGIEGGFGDPIASITGRKVTAYFFQNSSLGDNPYVDIKVIDATDPAQFSAYQSTILAAISANKPIWIGSQVKTSDAFGNTLLTGGHAFSLLNANKAAPTVTSVDIYNPWGISTLPTPPGPVGHLSPFPEAGNDLIALIGNQGLMFMVG